MRWRAGDRSNVQDLRGGGGRGLGVPLGIGGVLVLLVGSWLTGVNLFDVVGSVGSGEPHSGMLGGARLPGRVMPSCGAVSRSECQLSQAR